MLVDPTGTNSTVTGAIRQAARMTGTDFRYLLATAQVESSLNPGAQVPTSSARGLFQFIEQTWLATLKEQGPALGFQRHADAITRLPSGQYAVTDPLEDTIMSLRGDPAANALMAGAYTRVNAGKLAERLGRNPTDGELYLAHFLGPNGASRLIGLAESRPMMPAAPAFPGAARANPTVFYDRTGRARGAGEVYQLLVGRYDLARAAKSDPTSAAAVAGNGARGPRSAFAPNAAGIADSYAAAARLAAASAEAADAGPVFYSLFHTGERREPVAPLVSALWGRPVPAQAAAAANIPQPPDAPAERSRSALDLFQDQAPDARALFRGRV